MLAMSGLLPSRQDNHTVQTRAAEVNMSLAIHMYRPNGLRGRKRYYVTTRRHDWRDMSTHLAFDALADEVRRSILQVIADRGECSAGEIADSVERVGRTTVSSHLRVLRTSGVVIERRAGRYRYYSLDPEGPARAALEFLQGLLKSSLRELKADAEALAPSGSEPRREAG
jgi:ArsR family transcriptional regulator, arsenate/arsenite/antimonite-responsive transcriptional repressor